MSLQHTNKDSADIALVTDSTCDLPEELLGRFPVYALPLQISLGEASFLDGVELAPAAFQKLY